ncbi:MAG: L,D-transpeptidase family protein, partial [Myxococcota bacterium]
GGGDTDFGQPVHVVATGRVVEAGQQPDPWGGVIVVEHTYYENHHRKRIRSVYVHLSRVDVKVGDVVKRRQRIGAIGKDPGGTYPAHLHLELRHDDTLESTFWPSSAGWDEERIRQAYVDPSAFIRAHRTLFVPQDEPVLVLVDQATYRVRVYEKGAKVLERGVAFGQATGTKERLGDLRTPAGMYFVVDKSTGPFSGDYADFYGGHWIKLNYPNAYDADRGLAEGIVDEKTRNAIARQWRTRKLTQQRTRLGGGIGFHGWISTWDAGPGAAHLSWGCVVMQPTEIPDLYERVSEGTMVVVF